jgi:excisionase family DNA binding protein
VADATLTKAEAAKVLGVSERTIHTWVERGILATPKDEDGALRPTVASVNDRITERTA